MRSMQWMPRMHQSYKAVHYKTQIVHVKKNKKTPIILTLHLFHLHAIAGYFHKQLTVPGAPRALEKPSSSQLWGHKYNAIKLFLGCFIYVMWLVFLIINICYVAGLFNHNSFTVVRYEKCKINFNKAVSIVKGKDDNKITYTVIKVLYRLHIK